MSRRRRDRMHNRTTTTSLLRQINRSAVVGLVRKETVVTPSSLAARLNISIPTVMRVIDGLIAEDLVEYDGFDEALRGRPPARIKFKGAAHAIVGIEASRGEFYGAVADLNGQIQHEMYAPADDKDGMGNVERLIALITALMAAPRPKGQEVRGIGIGVPSIVKQPDGEVVLTLGLGWRDLPLRKILTEHFDLPVYVENGRNLAAIGESGFGAGQGASSLISLSIGPGAGAGVVIDGKLFGGHAHAAGELSWYLDDPLLSGRSFQLLGDKQSLRFGGGIPRKAIDALKSIDAKYRKGEIGIDAVTGSAATTPELAIVAELLDYTVMAVASISAFMNPEVVILAGQLSEGAALVVDAVRARLAGNIYDPPHLVMSDLGHRDIVLGATMLVLDATILNPAHP
jgi:predicted NBD/HSP70 family sugar kinase